MYIATCDEMSNTLVGMFVQQLADRCARLPRLTDKRTEAAGQHPFGRPISADSVEAPADWAVECCCDDLPTTSNLSDLALRFDGTEARDLPRHC